MASFQDMVALKGKSDIGDKINTQIIQPLIDANTRLARSDFPDFNDPNKLGQGQEIVERLTNLIVAPVEEPQLVAPKPLRTRSAMRTVMLRAGPNGRSSNPKDAWSARTSSSSGCVSTQKQPTCSDRRTDVVSA